MRTEDGQTIFLKDYAPSPFRIERVELEVRIAPDTALVRALLTIEPHPDTAPGTPLVLDGNELKLESIALDGAPMMLVDYEATPDHLTVFAPPQRRFVLETEVRLEPEKNVKLMGFYRSGGTWCTQCEPEGFRRITYFSDRPDVLATYKVTLVADRGLAPVLLANGNLIETGDRADGQHYAVWEDPHPKPSYLFAMVAGDLGSIHDTFVTASGRTVKLGIYCTHGKESECLYAMDALKRSMAWDERRFGREYDLDVFNIVAVSDFNFGAMENKGLNIFNDKLVFAKPETATDADFDGVERVIAHEYFHNWTGNRITCRDWFQLCLKEGLTVYRDQEFTSDERSRAVKRISDVRNLRAVQFPEDGGPLAHAARPDHYKEINNFYTATVYDKGAEIVRMLATLLGDAGFRKGMDLYFERHDGQATTIEAFLKVFEDATGEDLQKFGQWYLQAGTPRISYTDHYDAASQTYTLTITQKTDPTPGQADKQALVMPVKFGLVGPNGSPMDWSGVSGATVRDDLIVFDTEKAELTFTGIANRPVPSLFRAFSAPVKITSNATQADRLFLAQHDSDPFNRWQALQDVALALMVDAVAGKAWAAADAAALGKALEETITNGNLDDAFKALALTLPPETLVGRTIGVNVDADRIAEVRDALLREVFGSFAPTLRTVYDAKAGGPVYNPGAAETGRRSLRNQALASLVRAGAGDGLAERQYADATNMTDRYAALSILVGVWSAEAPALLADFRSRYGTDPLVFDKWLMLNAIAPDKGVIERLRAILAEPDFPRSNPNRLRALAGTFALNNAARFAQADGAGFRFLAEFVADVDKRNPQVAARVLIGFRVWREFEPKRRAAAEAALRWLKDSGTLSRNTTEILDKTLEPVAK